jgi:nucleoside-diphosphate-sugar epimerase
VKLLVTGGTGFIGSHLAEDARRRGGDVVVLGLTDRPEEEDNARLLESLGVQVLPGSVTDAALCARAMEGVTHVYHLAVAMREAGMTDEYFEEINLGGTRRLLELAGERGLQRFVYCSTIGIFGHRAPGITNEDSPLRPGNVYERTKVAAEALAQDFRTRAGLPVVILRPADVYGPRDQRLLKLFRGVAAGRFPLFGDGRGRRHMVFVDDVVAAFRLASERDQALGQALIIAGPESCTLRELIDAVARATGQRRFGWRLPLAPMLAVAAMVEDGCAALNMTPPIYRRRMDFFDSDSAFDTTRARKVLGWEPKVHLNEGVGRTLDAYRKAGLI